MKGFKRGIVRIIEDAQEKGLNVIRHSDGTVSINKGKRGVGIRIFQDGVAVRNDVDLTIAIAIRTQKQMREILGLN